MTIARVITIQDNERSMQTARRCIKTGAKVNVEVINWKATTPEDDPEQIAEDKGIPTEGFQEVYSRFERCLSAFLSHHSLWEHCVEINKSCNTRISLSFNLYTLPIQVNKTRNVYSSKKFYS